jgi:RNA polymerase sigma-70 factor, ECF subfamily
MTAVSRDIDDEDLGAVYERVRARLRAMASRVVGWDDAEDVVQEAFIRALTFHGVFRRQASRASWITRILLNAAVDETRRRKRRPSYGADPNIRALDRGAMPTHPMQLELKAALSESSRVDREVLVLAGLLGLSHEETAQRLGLTARTTKSRLCSARRRLRRRLMDDGTDSRDRCRGSRPT